MRNAFAAEIKVRAETDRRITLLSGDIGNRLFDPFKETCGDRFFNCGVAEANMIGVAAGLARNGLRPVAYTIAPFVTTRCLEQIKLDLCYHNLPVVVVGVGAGLSYAGLGPTHHSFEDIAILRPLPGMTIFTPCDAVETRLCLRAALELNGPSYIRLGKKNEPVVHAVEPEARLGRGIVLRDHAAPDVSLLCAGTLMPEVLAAADALSARGLGCRAASMFTVKPFDEALVADCLERSRLTVAVEEHSLVGGFGSAVAEWRADHDAGRAPFGRLLRVGLEDAFVCRSGNQNNARAECGLDAAGLERRVLAALAPEERQ